MAWRIALYGLILAAGTLILEALDYYRLALRHGDDLYIGLIAAGFLALGLGLGAKLWTRAPARGDFDGNPAAQEALGLSAREVSVLAEIAAGRSNKEIARVLDVSPNTVKTHIAHVYEKLGAKRRTDAVNKARTLGLLP